MIRNFVDIAFVTDGFDELWCQFIPTELTDCLDYPMIVQSVQDNCLEYAIQNTILQRDLGREATSLYIASEASAYYFSRGYGNKDELLIANRFPVGIPDEPLRHYLSTVEWWQSYLLCCLCRNQRCVDLLMAISHEQLKPGPGILLVPECHNSFAQALRYWELGDERAGEFMVKAIRETDPEREDMGDGAYGAMLMAQWVYCAAMVMSSESNALEAINNALKKHQEYYEKSPRDWKGWVAIQLTAVAALYWDKGHRFEINSDYMPMHWVTGEFLKDVDLSLFDSGVE